MYNSVMVIYIDVFFLYNFVCDFLIIFSAGRFAGARPSAKRYCLGAAVGAAYSCLAAVFGGAFYSALPCGAAVMLISFVAYRARTPRRFIKDCVLFMLCSAAAGGGAFALSFGGAVVRSVLSLIICAGMAVISASGVITGKRKYIKIIVKKDGAHYCLNAMADSGLTCLDGLSGLPILVAENIFPAYIKEKARTVYAKTAAGVGKLAVFLPDEVIFTSDGAVYSSRCAAIGITDERLSEDGRFNALVGGAFFERAEGKNKINIEGVDLRGRNLLHRRGGAASAASGKGRGGDAAEKLFGRR